MKKIILSVASFALLFGANFLTSCTKEGDISKPMITLKGSTITNIPLNTTYIDSGATAWDDKDGDITSSIITDKQVLNNLKGSYAVCYIVSDAAFNSTTATRTVNVVNSAENFACSYIVTKQIAGSTPVTYTDNIITSDITNNRILVKRFAYHDFGSVYFDVLDTIVTIPHQTIICGNPLEPHTFVGNGTIIGTTITVNYTETVNGISIAGIETFVKQ